MTIDKLALLKNIYGNNEEEVVLEAYLAIAAEAVLNRLYPFDKSKTEVPDKYALTQVNIAIYLLNKRGAEGELQHNENGIDRTYESGNIPESMLKDIIPHCGVFG